MVVQLPDDGRHRLLDCRSLEEMQVQLRAQHPLSDSLSRLSQRVFRGEVSLPGKARFHDIVPDRRLTYGEMVPNAEFFRSKLVVCIRRTASH